MKKKISTSLVASFFIATNLFSNETLESIYITSATKTQQAIKDVTSNIEVITKEELEEKHFTSVIEALNTLSGVSFSSNGGLGNTSSFYLRGMGNDKTLVLIDGIRYQDPSNTSGSNLSHLMINEIERIELIKGAQSGIWGADAASGVINIITKKAKKGTKASINLEAGSYKTKKYGASLSHGSDNFDIKVSANKLETDGFSSKTPNGKNPEDFESDSYENTTLNLNTNYYINDNSKINLNITNIDALAQYDSSSPNDDTMKSDIDTTLYGIGFSHRINNHNLKLKYEQSKFKRHEIGSKFGVLKFNGKTHNIEISDEYKYLDDDFLLFGIGLNKDDVDYVKVDNTKNNRNSKGKYLYATNSNKFDKIIFTQSLRYDRYDNFDNKLTGKVGLKYNINKDLFLSSNLGSAYNIPSIIKQLNPWGEANLNLQPEETKSFDLGFGYKNFSAIFFKSKVDNLIDWRGRGYTNVQGESKFKGYELKYQKDIFKDTLISLNYTYLSAKDSKGKYLDRRPKNQIGFSLDYYGIDNLHLNLNSTYVGDRKQNVYKVGEVKTGNYTLWNGAANYDINKNLKVYLKFDNMFDKYYQTTYGYGTARRSLYLGLKASF